MCLCMFTCRSGKTSDEVMMDLCHDMLKRIPPFVQDDDENTDSSAQYTLCYRDMLKLVSGVDLLRIKKKLKVPDPPKRKENSPEVRDDWKEGLKEVRMLCSSAMYTIMRQEIDRFNSLLRIIHRSLKGLIKAVKVCSTYYIFTSLLATFSPLSTTCKS